MHLNHINLSVNNVPQAVDIFGRLFDLQRAGNEFPQNDYMTFLKDDSGALISVTQTGNLKYPESFHIGFLLDSAEQVRDLHAKLTAEGFKIPPPAVMHGWLTFYFEAPFGVTIEVETANY